MKGERMEKRSSFGNIMRRRLSDITNTQSQSKFVGLIEEQPRIPECTQDLIDQLLLVKQEKAMLLKLVEERNKIIELSGNKLRDLRMNYQNLQLQNWNLAQSNSQMLAELNLGREKLKALQHEVVCKDALHKARNLEAQGKADVNCQNAVSQEVEKIEEAECLPEASNDIKPCGRSGRRTGRSRSMGPSTTNRKTAEKEKTETKRQSARFKSQEREPAEKLFEIEVAKFPVSRDKSKKENGLTSSITKEETCGAGNEAQVSLRSSIGRPLRRAAEKVQSYKEVPVNVKMRRAEFTNVQL
ncbi:SHUGOSHIN 2-like isoform X2 [Populus nigra]|uniref:SHUGOSHIN 2-like isoform X2 n=1 Tax=Populus nigra TaxID=3691 RepID=UPI002B274627|nr:SHUGOSHIN 2-like isoform X2 [Populus nigra]